MSQEQLNYLATIYNNLMTVETKGESLLILANCLNELQQFILNQLKILREKGDK